MAGNFKPVKLFHKYHAKPTVCDNIKFPSQKEANRYMELKVLQNRGDVIFFLRQVPFHLPGGVVYRVDFQIFWSWGDVTFEDAKGMRTDEYIMKKKMVEDLYPIEIKEV
jgi:hypothetical protein